ncbi:MAG TPA: glycoside hydrolase family 38 C-terminal domain-containing protein [Phycisphaerae bacterium]|nr:glycoside hydrolase family 38 C-terminal domain-containing protein [Phycisphaerae bacterium]HPS52350.1 glycoside hydrolase family 38 C-terminal domain-containing protein [Phycisphaerae bacterium]
MKTIHLICNAHLDPVWQWPWEEGAAEAVSTFRVAAEFCEKFDGFVFCHNEVVLYEWIEEYEPQLFKKIQKLVKAGKWHIMGGWYLQPDCNMPAGESFVRQILLGREYFWKKFGKRPTTAINFDPFGHSRGLVQIMAKCGFDSYLFWRPNNTDCPLPDDLFIWEGFDGSRVTGLRQSLGYNTCLGKAVNKIKDFMAGNYRHDTGLLLWGIGDHGGGPSHEDLQKIAMLIKDTPAIKIFHSTPEAFFKQVKHEEKNLPVVSKSLNAWAVGCYTSQVLIKQLNRKVENELFATEKMLTSAWKQGVLAEYPADELYKVMRDMAFLQFHDIFPGSSVEEVEETSIRLANHALEELSRLKARAFFSLASGQKKATNGYIPILVYNPHPFRVNTTVECEYQLEDVKFLKDGFHIGVACMNGRELPSQMEKEASSIALDWRKKVVFNAILEPSQMNRFDCKLIKIAARPTLAIKAKNGQFRFKTKDVEVVINAKTGLMDKFRVNGKDMVGKSAFLPLVVADNEDPWGMLVDRFRKVVGRFRLLSAQKSAEFSGLKAKKFPPVRVIEDGDVRTVIEAVFGYNDSFICQHYILPKRGTEVGVTTRVIWGEKNKMLKLDIPVAMKGTPKVFGQVAYGVEELPADDRELVAQKWSAVANDSDAITLINNGVYGFDFVKGSLRPTLLRSASYCSHPIENEPQIIPQDRFLPRIDTGQRIFKFLLNAGTKSERFAKVDRESIVYAEKPMTLSFFPCGDGKKPGRFVTLSDDVIELSAMKKAQKGDGVIIRLFNPTDKKRKTTLSVPAMKINRKLELTPFEIKSFNADSKSGRLTEITPDERPL